MKNYSDIDSKFRFVIVAAKRAKSILKGSKPKIKTKSKNAIRIAQKEVKEGLVDFEILQPKKDELLEADDKVFLGEDIGGIVEDEDVKLPKALLDEETEAEEEETEEEENLEEEASGEEDKDVDPEIEVDIGEDKDEG